MAFTFKHGDKPLDGYVIQRGVGRGGFGEVYYALSEGGKEVALKYLRDNPQIELRGVSHCMNLKSPYLVTIYDVRQNADGDNFIVMEYINGPSLRDLLVAEPNGLGLQKAAFFISELGKGLGYLHDRGIIHRDMKPGNIFYEDGYVKIGDYGLSKFISLSRHSGQTASVGTVHYMAPEVGSGNYHRGIDIYALGVMLYEMILGRVPFEGSSMGEVLMKHLTEQPEVDNLPAPFAEVIRKALAKDPKDRYQTVHEMAQDILGVEDVRKSIADFEPGSLTAVARQAMETQVMDSPHPSPNAVRGPQGAAAVAAAAAQRRRDPQEVLDAKAFSDRLAGRMEKVAARAGRGRGVPQEFMPGQDGWGTDSDIPLRPPTRMARIKGFVISMIVALGLSLGAAIIVGDEYWFASVVGVTFGFIVALRLGIAVSGRIIRRMTVPNPSEWVTGLITLGCSMLPVLLIWQIAHEETRGEWHDMRGLMLAVLAISGFVNWSRRVRTGLLGRVEFKDALKAGFFGLIAGAACSEGESEFMIMAATIGAATSLALQTGALFARRVPVAPVGHPDADQKKSDEPKSDEDDVKFAGVVIQAGWGESDKNKHQAQAGYEQPTPAGGSGYPLQRRPRPKLFRVFWIVVALALAMGCAISAMAMGLIAEDDDDTMGFGIALVNSALWMFFFLYKSTRYKRIGFWNETLRPFLTTAFFGGAATMAMLIAFVAQDDEDLFGFLCGLVPCAVLGLVCLFAGRIPRYDIDVSELSRPISRFATVGLMLLSLIVSLALTGAAMMLFGGGQRTVHFPSSRSYVIESDMGREFAARAYSEAVEEELRVPFSVLAPQSPSGPRVWKPVKGLKGAQSSWQRVGKKEFVVFVRSRDCIGKKNLKLLCISRNGDVEQGKFRGELCGDVGERKYGPFRLEQIPDLREVEVSLLHR